MADLLRAEVAGLQRELLLERDRSSGLEAASVLLQPEADEPDAPPREHAWSNVQAEERRGTRSAFGAVSLSNVPAMHGGSRLERRGSEGDMPTQNGAPTRRAIAASFVSQAPGGAAITRKISFSRSVRKGTTKALKRSLSFGSLPLKGAT